MSRCRRTAAGRDDPGHRQRPGRPRRRDYLRQRALGVGRVRRHEHAHLQPRRHVTPRRRARGLGARSRPEHGVGQAAGTDHHQAGADLASLLQDGPGGGAAGTRPDLADGLHPACLSSATTSSTSCQASSGVSPTTAVVAGYCTSRTAPRAHYRRPSGPARPQRRPPFGRGRTCPWQAGSSPASDTSSAPADLAGLPPPPSGRSSATRRSCSRPACRYGRTETLLHLRHLG